MRTCGMNLIKYLLFVFNFFFALSGLAVLLTGALVLADVGEFSHFIEGRVIAPPIILIVVGALVFFVATLGCYGAIKESPRLLMLFALMLAVIFIVEMAVGFAAIAFKSDLEMALKSSLEKTIARSNGDDLRAWDGVQRKLECCGVTGQSDWVDLSKNHTLRTSCCRPNYINPDTKDCKNAPALYQHKYYTDGCVSKLQDRIGSSASVLTGVGIGIAFVQLIGIVLAYLLANAIRRERAK